MINMDNETNWNYKPFDKKRREISRDKIEKKKFGHITDLSKFFKGD